MSDINETKEIGLRCRRQRMAKGMSQADLADKMNTSIQTISKYENEGISNIETIRRLSKILEKDLLVEERDTNGSVGEVGKEILLLLLESGGNIEMNAMLRKYMHGMNMSMVSKEISKLDNIGLCVREQYTDVVGDDHDTVFITAKGVITMKHCLGYAAKSDEFDEEYKNCKTYEDVRKEYSIFDESKEFLISEYDTYEQYQKARPIVELVRRLKFMLTYRADFTLYIKTTTNQIEEFDNDWFTHTNCFCDVIYRMVNNITQDVLLIIQLEGSEEDFDQDVEDEFSNIMKLEEFLNEESNTLKKAKYVFCKYSPEVETNKNSNSLKSLFLKKNLSEEELSKLTQEISKEIVEDCYRKISPTENDSEFILRARKSLAKLYGVEGDEFGNITLDEFEQIHDNKMYEYDYGEIQISPKTNFASIIDKKGTDDPLQWFTKEEIEAFINENYLPASNDEEKKQDELLNEIMEKDVYLRSYYEFPVEWEENGLADLVRSKYGIKKHTIKDEVEGIAQSLL